MKYFKSQSKTSISRFLKLTLGIKWITPCESAWKTVPKNAYSRKLYVFLFEVPNLCLWKDVKEKCQFLSSSFYDVWIDIFPNPWHIESFICMHEQHTEIVNVGDFLLDSWMYALLVHSASLQKGKKVVLMRNNRLNGTWQFKSTHICL